MLKYSFSSGAMRCTQIFCQQFCQEVNLQVLSDVLYSLGLLLSRSLKDWNKNSKLVSSLVQKKGYLLPASWTVPYDLVCHVLPNSSVRLAAFACAGLLFDRVHRNQRSDAARLLAQQRPKYRILPQASKASSLRLKSRFTLSIMSFQIRVASKRRD